MPRPFTEAEFADLLAAPPCFLCTRPDAFALGRTAAGEAELLTLAVAPRRRRHGLGRLLLQDFEAASVARGAVRAFLEVAATNDAARALYRAAGYREAGRRPGYYRRPDGAQIDALILDKPLGSA